MPCWEKTILLQPKS